MILNHNLDDLRTILKKTDRNQPEIDYLKNFLSRFTFFDEIFLSYKDNPEFINQLCSVIQYESANAWTIII
jgi:hypothetical protein